MHGQTIITLNIVRLLIHGLPLQAVNIARRANSNFLQTWLFTELHRDFCAESAGNVQC